MKLLALLLLVAFVGMVSRRRKEYRMTLRANRVTWPANVRWLPDFRDGEPDGV